MSRSARAKRESAWLTALRLPRWSKAAGLIGVASGRASAYSMMRSRRLFMATPSSSLSSLLILRVLLRGNRTGPLNTDPMPTPFLGSGATRRLCPRPILQTRYILRRDLGRAPTGAFPKQVAGHPEWAFASPDVSNSRKDLGHCLRGDPRGFPSSPLRARTRQSSSSLRKWGHSSDARP